MIKLKNIFLQTILFITLAVNNSFAQKLFEVVIPNAESEAQYIWQTIRDIKFFEQHNYHVSLPNGYLIEELKNKAKENLLSDVDFNKLLVFISDSIYNKDDYKCGYKKIIEQSNLLNSLISILDSTKYNWKISKFDSYKIRLTLYGPGGSYNPEEGSILLFTTKDGQFKNYQNPANTIIHEIIHIGIENSIVTKFNIPHTAKERIVDLFVKILFSEQLPEYKIQSLGNSRVDENMLNLSDITNLETRVKKMVQMGIF